MVLNPDEVKGILQQMSGEYLLVAHLLYGTGMRILEALRLRVKDIDFDRRTIVIREAKGNKDRAVMLPVAVIEPLKLQLARANGLCALDRKAQLPDVEMPCALDRKYPRAGQSWIWHWVFPQATVCTDPRSGTVRRHHLYVQSFQRAFKLATDAAAIYKPATPHTLRHSFATHVLNPDTTYEPCRNCRATPM